ncbi:hypothetical protein AIIKEEIJ_03010 [Rhodococcus sp. YH1]|nr:hypothetical protein [Rhodococcus sp. YH1]
MYSQCRKSANIYRHDYSSRARPSVPRGLATAVPSPRVTNQ